jgi:hypothetical protein
MNTFRNYADYEIPLLQVLADLPGGQGTAQDVRDRFGEQFDDRIPVEHQVYLENAHVTKWRNIVAWVRSGLVGRGLMDAPKYGIWRITDAGRAYLVQAANTRPPTIPSAPAALPTVEETEQPLVFTIKKRAVTLTARHVLDVGRRELARGLPPAAQDFRSWVAEVDGQPIGLKWLFGITTGLSHAEFTTNGAQRIFQKLGISVRQTTRGTEEERLLRAASANRPERPRNETRAVASPGAHAIIDSQIAAMRDFLNGRAGRPSDERLCDWVHLCYEFELYREGQELFDLVDPTQVNPWYYERAKRLAKVCAMKVAGHA